MFFFGGAVVVEGDEFFEELVVGEIVGLAVGVEDGGVEVVVELFEDGDEAAVVDLFVFGREVSRGEFAMKRKTKINCPLCEGCDNANKASIYSSASVCMV